MEARTQATFRCHAVADPSLPLEILWLINDQAIDFDAEPRFIKSSDYSLTISKTNELDSGTYTCVAKTPLDEVKASATLIVQGKYKHLFYVVSNKSQPLTNFGHLISSLNPFHHKINKLQARKPFVNVHLYFSKCQYRKTPHINGSKWKN